MTSLVSMRVTREVAAEPRVMGMASFSRLLRMRMEPSGRSVAWIRWRRFRSRKKRYRIYSRATTLPQDTPMMAPTLPSSGFWITLTRNRARARPTTSLKKASMTWEIPVGIMLKWPWK